MMDADTPGPAVSTSKPEVAPRAPADLPRRDKQAPARRARILQALLMQGGLALILLMFALFSWGDTRSMLLFIVTLVIPVGWAALFWRAYQRDERARSDGVWTRETDAAERRRTFSAMGLVFAGWLVAAATIVVLV